MYQKETAEMIEAKLRKLARRWYDFGHYTETVARITLGMVPASGRTDVFISPGYEVSRNWTRL